MADPVPAKDSPSSVPRQLDQATFQPAGSTRGRALPSLFALALAALGLLTPMRLEPRALAAVLGAAALLVIWNIVLVARATRNSRTLSTEIELRKQHYLQACAQFTVLSYWGWHWPTVYESAHFIAAQLLFAYAFDMLLVWSRRDRHTLGFAPVPVIFSINLFLWFRPDWFYLQLLMVAVGFAAKELIRWEKEGRQAHVFNPSSFPLALFSVGLIATGTSDLTWGKEIASTQFYPPNMYLLLFLVGLPGQFLFGVTTMTMSAVVTTYVFGLAYFAATGTYFFFDSYIPIAVFLGMHLLFTDPSTSPRTELGRVIFGVLYGLATVGLYVLLGSFGLPTFYDKLLQVPVLNLSIKLIDRVARSKALRAIDPAALGRSLSQRERNLGYMTVWAVVFAIMSGVQGVGDSHPGQWLPFWQQACTDGRAYACGYLTDVEASFCARGSAWACNDVGILQQDVWGDETKARSHFERGCDLGLSAACRNAAAPAGSDGVLVSTAPTVEDFPVILKGAKGDVRERAPDALYALACRQGWPGTCRPAP